MPLLKDYLSLCYSQTKWYIPLYTEVIVDGSLVDSPYVPDGSIKIEDVWGHAPQIEEGKVEVGVKTLNLPSLKIRRKGGSQ